MEQEKVFYLSASIAATASSKFNFAGDPIWGMAHFYVRCEDELTAGAWAHDICRRMGLVLGEYIYHPHEETRQTVHSPDEHKIAFDQALRDGEAIIISILFDKLSQTIRPFDVA